MHTQNHMQCTVCQNRTAWQTLKALAVPQHLRRYLTVYFSQTKTHRRKSYTSKVSTPTGWQAQNSNSLSYLVSHYSCKNNRGKKKHAQNEQNRKTVLQEAFQPATQHHTETPKGNGCRREKESKSKKKKSRKNEEKRLWLALTKGHQMSHPIFFV